MIRLPAAWIPVLLSASLWGGAEILSVTNHAGHAVSGEFGGVTNGTFLLSGRAYPLSILPATEQTRLRVLAGQDVRSAREKAIARDLAYQLERVRVREAEGEITAEKAASLRADAIATAEFRRRASTVVPIALPSVSTNAVENPAPVPRNETPAQ